MIYGLVLSSLVVMLWAPCIRKGLWAEESGPVFAKDRKNRIFRITPTGECCKGEPYYEPEEEESTEKE